MRIRFLDLGELTVDEAWFIEGASVSTLSQPNPPSVRRRVKLIGALIEHPSEGVILFEAGPGANFRAHWPEVMHELFPMTSYSEANRLEAQLEKAGYRLKDVSAVVMGHLHVDHAGGLEAFKKTGVPIYVHESELKYAFYAVATKEDFGAYLPYYLDPQLNWKAVHEAELELFEGITVYHTPGHTPGTMSMKVELKRLEPFILTTDTFFFKENFYDERGQGWLIRDRMAWWRSLRKIKNLAARNRAHLIFGHDPDIFAEYSKEEFYD